MSEYYLNGKPVDEDTYQSVMNGFKEEIMWFDLNKVLTPVTASKMDNGQKGWVNDSITYLMSDVKDLPSYEVIKTGGRDYPFERYDKKGSPRRYFYPAE